MVGNAAEIKEAGKWLKPAKRLVPGAGIEPARYFYRGILSPSGKAIKTTTYELFVPSDCASKSTPTVGTASDLKCA